VRGLAAGEKGYEKYKKLFQTKFIFLNEYCTSVKAEHDPRGPEGPYRFQDRSVPVLLFKRWDGKTLIQQLGFQPNPEQAKKSLARYVDKALKENGPVVPPKALRPLLKAQKKGMEHLAKKRYGTAIREFQKIEKAAANKKKFPEPPDLLADVQAQLKQLLDSANEQLAELEGRLAAEPDAVKKALNVLGREYGKLPGIKEKVKALRAQLP